MFRDLLAFVAAVFLAISSNLDCGIGLVGGICVVATPAALNLVRNCRSVVAPFLVLQVRQAWSKEDAPANLPQLGRLQKGQGTGFLLELD